MGHQRAKWVGSTPCQPEGLLAGTRHHTGMHGMLNMGYTRRAAGPHALGTHALAVLA